MPHVPDRVWSEREWERIQQGYHAQDMDEKWNAFVEGDVLFLHRSWTGRGVYEASFAPIAGGGRKIVSAVVEADTRHYRSPGDEHDQLMLELVISAIVLGEPATELRAALRDLTARLSGKNDAPAGALEHSVVGLRSASPRQASDTDPNSDRTA
ncbi:hypothetical protein ADL22_10820 [Streptomyces sp. NRRL F-4489]|nr:hypothetical protein ADL22_10820 [Streptomyces sp. NRRL F-4489]